MITGPVDTDGGEDEGGDDDPILHPPKPEDPVIVICNPPPFDNDPISSDGDPTGTTGVQTGPGPGGPHGPGDNGGGGVSGGGIAAGGVGGAAGLAGMLRNRAGGGIVPAGGSSAARGQQCRGARLSRTCRRGGTPGWRPCDPRRRRNLRTWRRVRPRQRGQGSDRLWSLRSSQLGSNGAVPVGGGQAGKGTGASKGTGKAGARGAARPAMGAAGAGGSRKGDAKNQPQDVDKLTHEDEEAWFEGTEESSPPGLEVTPTRPGLDAPLG